jgi:hypothetical protein
MIGQSQLGAGTGGGGVHEISDHMLQEAARLEASLALPTSEPAKGTICRRGVGGAEEGL